MRQLHIAGFVVFTHLGVVLLAFGLPVSIIILAKGFAPLTDAAVMLIIFGHGGGSLFIIMAFLTRGFPPRWLARLAVLSAFLIASPLILKQIALFLP